jgi:hypothetical protein
VRFDIDFDPAPSITEPNDDDMTQNLRFMKTLAIKSEMESRGVSTDTFIEKNELINALLKIRREEEEKRNVVDPAKLSDPSAPEREANERHNAQLKIRRKEEKRDVVDPADLSDHCAPKGGVNERHLLYYATTMTHRQNIPQSTTLKSHFSNLSTNEGTYSVNDDPSIMTDHAVVMSKPMSNRVQGYTASASVVCARQNSIIGKILAPSKLHIPHRSSNIRGRRREDPNSVSVTQNSSAYNQSYDQEQSSQDNGRQSHMRRFFRR